MNDIVERLKQFNGWAHEALLLEAANEITQLLAENERLRAALDESVKLQSHYAALLNDYDGGRRMQFANTNVWIERLESIQQSE